MTVTVTQHCYCISNCSSWFISYCKLDNYWAGNWQYGTNFYGLFVSLGRNMLEERRKTHDYWLGIGTTNILKRSVELIVASVMGSRTCLVLLRTTLCMLLTTVEQINKQTDMLISLIVMSLKFIILLYSSEKCKAQSRAVLQCLLWILDQRVMWHHANCVYVRITGSVKMNIVTNFSNNWIIIPLGLSVLHLAQREPREKQLVFCEPSHSTLRYHDGVSVPSTEGSGIDFRTARYFSPQCSDHVWGSRSPLISNFQALFPQSLKRLNHEAVIQLPLMLWFTVCGGRLHLLPTLSGRGVESNARWIF